VPFASEKTFERHVPPLSRDETDATPRHSVSLFHPEAFGAEPTMMRTLTTFVGFGLAALILWLAPDIGDLFLSSAWGVALAWVAAGAVGALFYQIGGGLRLRPNLPLLALVAAPWTLLAAGLVAVSASDPVWIADRTREALPDAWLGRFLPSTAAFAFGSGLLIAFGVLGPRRAERVAAVEDPALHDHDVVQEPVAAPTAELVGTPAE
jgi:hypothetical protein